MRIVPRMHSHNKIISINAKKGLFIPKNNKDQLKFKISCRAKKRYPPVLFREGEEIKREREIAIKTYKIVQTIGKTMFGGVPGARIKSLYHVLMLCSVTRPQSQPPPTIKIIEKNKFL